MFIYLKSFYFFMHKRNSFSGTSCSLCSFSSKDTLCQILKSKSSCSTSSAVPHISRKPSSYRTCTVVLTPLFENFSHFNLRFINRKAKYIYYSNLLSFFSTECQFLPGMIFFTLGVWFHYFFFNRFNDSESV